MTPLPELPDAERLEQPAKTFRLVMIEKDLLSPTIGEKGKMEEEQPFLRNLWGET